MDNAVPQPPKLENLTDSQRHLIISLAVNDLQTKASKHEAILITGHEGTLPLVERVRNLESYTNNTKYWTRFVAGALVLQTVAFAGSVLWAAVRLVPILERLVHNTP